MPRAIKVIHLITELNPGGAEQLLLYTVQHRWPSYFRHLVVTLYDGDTPLAATIRSAGVPVVDLAMKRDGRYRGVWRLYWLLRREKPAVIHNWLFHAALLGRIMGRIAGEAAIVTSRHSVNLGGRWRERLNRYTIRLDDKTIAICDYMRQVEITQTGTAKRRVVTIYNGIPPITFPPHEEARAALLQSLCLPPNSLLVGTVGRLHKAKGYADLAVAIPQIVAKRPQTHFVWVGDGRELAALATQTAELGVTEQVHFLGSRMDVPDLLAAFDLFVMPSRWEGLSVAIMEAMAAGLPVVATAVGGTPELVIEGKTGLLVPPADPAAMAAAVNQLLANWEWAQQLGAASRERVQQHFTVGRMVQKIRAVYEEVAGGEGR